MSVALAIMLAPFIVAGLLLYFSLSLDDDHFPLKLLFSIFAIIAIMVGSAAVYDAQEVCTPTLDNLTRTYLDASNFTETYDYACFTNSDKAGSSYTLLKMSQWLIRLLIAYAFIYIAYYVFIRWKRKKRGYE